MAIESEAATALFSSLSELLRNTRALGHRSKDLGATGTALGVLKVLSRGDARPGDLAMALHVVPSVISRTIAPLEQDGLVERKVDPQDARASLIGLTPLGGERLSRVQQVYVQQLREILDSWTDDEAAQAASLLVRLDDALSGYSQSETHRRELSEALLPPRRPATPPPDPARASADAPTPDNAAPSDAAGAPSAPRDAAPVPAAPHHTEQVSA